MIVQKQQANKSNKMLVCLRNIGQSHFKDLYDYACMPNNRIKGANPTLMYLFLDLWMYS